jgi:hypothetical protein
MGKIAKAIGWVLALALTVVALVTGTWILFAGVALVIMGLVAGGTRGRQAPG